MTARQSFGVNAGARAYNLRGTREEAVRLAAELLCGSETKPCGKCAHCEKVLRGIHPDAEFPSPETGKKQLSLERVREAAASAYLMPNEASARVVVFAADELSVLGQNALLKLLEEPPAHIHIILFGQSPASLIPTVRSRCAELRGTEVYGETSPKPSALAEELISAAKRGGAALSKLSFALEELDRADVPALLNELRRRIAAEARDARSPFHGETLAKMLSTVEECGKYLEYNVGTPHIAAKLCAEWG
ncbi:MAG: hypothetical protein LBS90_00100 [Oscillospiraceae bacterium]|jgi:hypothetical protein|nr:hypothetical protein [Oscillospiraceae bacterium]